MDRLTPELILRDLGTVTLPSSVHCYDTVGSTMDLAREWLRLNPEDLGPALIIAEVQTSGRGRLGRRWDAPPGTALLTSLALRPSWLAPERVVSLVWMVAVALCEAIETVTTLRPALKWPNDVLLPIGAAVTTPAPPGDNQDAPKVQLGWGKTAGILLEVSLGAQGLDWAIIGCGVNVSAAPPPEASRYPATSIAAAAGAPVARLELLRAFLRRLDHWYTRLGAGAASALFAAWRARLLTLGREVRVETPSGLITGRAEDVDETGALHVRDGTGTTHVITTGDVGLLGT
ncbi:MAG: biotin--[acetyl-CoA-carboxylase] ligase [Oscillochloridaceae bacterium]|nr:biotin--[acetyl-CoA-carboxylase] ligase [Chloroflexaceae bacterium]MDW8391254.1 biotin--[acetyl-CoA-carboxylase] ligase [Oscillochloridaceae bacterium]